MSITKIGLEGEKMARLVLKKMGCVNIFQADWLIKPDDKWFVVEVKRKERFSPPPFWGHGLDIRQVKQRMAFYRDTGVRCLFLVFDLTDGKTYWQWLDVLEQGDYFDTRNNVRVYPMDNLIALSNKYNVVV